MNTVCYGASGFLGEEIVKRELAVGNKVLAVARNEKNLVKLKNKYNVDIYTGDISDMHTVRDTMRGADRVFVLSAIKGVDIAERQPYETCKTNIVGLMNILEASHTTKPEFVAFTSTDKAAQVSGVYGASKLIGEALMIEAQLSNPFTRYRVARYGNVLWSSGSVLTKWREKMEQGEKVYVTDPDMTRFFFTREQAADVLYQAIRSGSPKPHIPIMKGMRMGDLLEAMMQKYGRVEVEVIGNRGGENMHETMDGKVFSNQVPQYSIKEIKTML